MKLFKPESGSLRILSVSFCSALVHVKIERISGMRAVSKDQPNNHMVTHNVFTNFEEILPSTETEQMHNNVEATHAISLVSLLRASAIHKDLERGCIVHADVVKAGLLGNTIVYNSIINMYAKSGALGRAQEMFYDLPSRSVISWNMLIAGFVQNGCEEQALCCFQEMKEDGVSPDAITFTCILKACGYLGALSKGQDIHVEMAREGLVKGNIMAANALLDMYAKCGSLSEAEKVFNELPAKDVVSWTTLIGAYAQNGCGDEALCCFKQMEDEGLTPNIVTLICILRVCSMKRALDKGQEVHARSLKEGLPITSIVLVTTLMDMYAKCGMLLRAETLMAELSVRNVVTWTALITGYVQHGPNERALMCFELMQHEKVSPNIITYLCLLKACSSLGTLYMGQKIHSELVKKDLLEDQNASTALLDMYAKNGLLLEAYYTFDMLAVQDVTCWNALLTGYVQLGQCNGIFRLIESMIKDGQELDVITITIVLNACSHRGLLDEGLMYFSTMTTLHGITPTLEHHNCLLDLFGSAGLLDRAVWIIMDMPFLTNATVWHTMLGACQKCGDMNLGMWAFRHAAQLEDSNAAAYVLMSNISVSACWGENVSSSLQLF